MLGSSVDAFKASESGREAVEDKEEELPSRWVANGKLSLFFKAPSFSCLLEASEECEKHKRVWL